MRFPNVRSSLTGRIAIGVANRHGGTRLRIGRWTLDCGPGFILFSHAWSWNERASSAAAVATRRCRRGSARVAIVGVGWRRMPSHGRARTTRDAFGARHARGTPPRARGSRASHIRPRVGAADAAERRLPTLSRRSRSGRRHRRRLRRRRGRAASHNGASRGHIRAADCALRGTRGERHTSAHPPGRTRDQRSYSFRTTAHSSLRAPDLERRPRRRVVARNRQHG